MATRKGEGTRRVGLVKFSLSGLPANAIIKSVNLTMTCGFTSAGNQIFPLHEILAGNNGWIEGSTWNFKIPSTARWAGDAGVDGGIDAGCSVAGTDYASTPFGNLNYIANDPSGTAYDVPIPLDLFLRWKSGLNYGFIIIGADTASRTWNAGENTTVALRPKLTIVYTAPLIEKNYLGFGDSKTAGSVGVSYMDKMPLHFVEVPQRIAVSGTTVALRYATIGADLASCSGTPKYIFCNLGANETNSMPAEADWKTQYNAIIDAIQAKWADAKIYIARPWRRDYETECNTLAGWIADIVTAQDSANVKLGADERVIIENGDDGVTYSVDGIHYNAAGAQAMVNGMSSTL